MENWQAKAREYFPEFQTEIDGNSLGPSGVWIDLYTALTGAYETHPVNDNLIERIFDYAAWCFEQPETNDIDSDLSSAVAVALIENIPLSRSVSDDLHRWMAVETFEGFENLFRYHLTGDQFAKFRSDFLEKKKTWRGTPRL